MRISAIMPEININSPSVIATHSFKMGCCESKGSSGYRDHGENGRNQRKRNGRGVGKRIEFHGTSNHDDGGYRGGGYDGGCGGGDSGGGGGGCDSGGGGGGLNKICTCTYIIHKCMCRCWFK